jgi:uncharacterized protein YjcR
MNQVMVNAVELDMLMKENQVMKAEVLRLKRLLDEERHRVKLLTDEVAWAENGYTKRDEK